jgi:hypothetical protein
MNTQASELAFQPLLRDLDEMLPQRAIARAPGLQVDGGAARRFQPRRIGLAGGGGARIERFQIVHRHRRVLGIGPGEVGVKIKRRAPFQLDFRDQLAHLQAPVAQMHVADHRPAIGAVKPLQAIADDGGAQMADMHRLGDVGTAEIDHHGARFTIPCAGVGRTQPRIARQAIETVRQRRIGDVEIEKAGAGDFHFGECRISLQAACDLLGDGARIGLGGPRRTAVGRTAI